MANIAELEEILDGFQATGGGPIYLVPVLVNYPLWKLSVEQIRILLILITHLQLRVLIQPKEERFKRMFSKVHWVVYVKSLRLYQPILLQLKK